MDLRYVGITLVIHNPSEMMREDKIKFNGKMTLPQQKRQNSFTLSLSPFSYVFIIVSCRTGLVHESFRKPKCPQDHNF